MTKKEILETGTKDYCSPSLAAIAYKNGEMPLDGIDEAVGDAMEVYAKQQAIAFMRHCLEAGYLKPNEDGSVHLDYNYWHESNFTKPSEEIYTKFIEQQNKDNGRG